MYILKKDWQLINTYSVAKVDYRERTAPKSCIGHSSKINTDGSHWGRNGRPIKAFIAVEKKPFSLMAGPLPPFPFLNETAIRKGTYGFSNWNCGKLGF